VAADRSSASAADEVLAAARREGAVLQSIAQVAAGLLRGRAASIAVVDEVGRDVVFAAAAGEGHGDLAGARFRSGEGVAGAVVESGAPLVVDDLLAEPRFARDVATATGYVPDGIIAVPLLRAGATIGVMSVLDRGAGRPAPEDVRLLQTLAELAVRALDLGDGAPR
jgi:GAF domain-containing protein